ncbi:MAG: hypothetical protein DCF22_00480 [Leptolyngbya sp.]|nr:MAG: hypothetical protein DCF22_00480 [Leptolyngbya sp.]
MNYEQYISSPEWKQKRQRVIERDGCKCRTCWESEDLEVHHVSYERLFNEDLDDLITLCHQCHEAITTVIRRRRYSTRIITVSDHQRITPIIKIEVSHGKTNIEISDHEPSANPAPQWTNRRPFEPFLEGDETDLRQTRQD